MKMVMKSWRISWWQDKGDNFCSLESRWTSCAKLLVKLMEMLMEIPLIDDGEVR